MANKQSFTPEEWTKILESTMLAGMAVSAADPSGGDSPPFRRRCARGSPGPSRPTPFSAPLPIFARSRPF
jgi:hypothetical protein